MCSLGCFPQLLLSLSDYSGENDAIAEGRVGDALKLQADERGVRGRSAAWGCFFFSQDGEEHLQLPRSSGRWERETIQQKRGIEDWRNCKEKKRREREQRGKRRFKSHRLRSLAWTKAAGEALQSEAATSPGQLPGMANRG